MSFPEPFFHLLGRLGFAAVFFVLCQTAVADPLADLRTASALEGVEKSRLLRGEIFTARGTQGDFSRGVYTESCYFLKAAPELVQSTLLHWDPAKYKETEVSAYRSYLWPSTSEPFKIFQLDGKKPADRPLIDWTVAAGTRGDAGELHLRPDEVSAFRQVFNGHDASKSTERDALVNTAWQNLLQRQSDAVGGGGFAALPAYKSGGVTLRASDEIHSLLKMTPAIAARFSPLTGARPLFSGGTGLLDEVAPYAEESIVHGHTSFCLGVVASRRSADGFLAMDCTYYTADTYFLSVSLYQLWPWEGGTLVWQVDYASAPFRSYLGGVDRLFAGKEMTKDSTGAVQTFRKEIAARQNR